jgi:hypothetical protein
MRWWVMHPASIRGILSRRLVQAHETASHAQTALEQAANMLMGPFVRLWCLADGDGETREARKMWCIRLVGKLIIRKPARRLVDCRHVLRRSLVQLISC